MATNMRAIIALIDVKGLGSIRGPMAIFMKGLDFDPLFFFSFFSLFSQCDVCTFCALKLFFFICFDIFLFRSCGGVPASIMR